MELVEFLGVSEVREYEKYLGLLAMVGRNKKESLNYIKKECGKNYKGGRRGFYLKQGRKFCLRR